MKHDAWKEIILTLYRNYAPFYELYGRSKVDIERKLLPWKIKEEISTSTKSILLSFGLLAEV